MIKRLSLSSFFFSFLAPKGIEREREPQTKKDTRSLSGERESGKVRELRKDFARSEKAKEKRDTRWEGS